jgi:hypothetical protein
MSQISDAAPRVSRYPALPPNPLPDIPRQRFADHADEGSHWRQTRDPAATPIPADRTGNQTDERRKTMTMPAAADHASLSVHQTSHGQLSGVLRVAARVAVESESEVGSIGCRASAALYSLLAAHPVDRRGRCRSCRGPGWLGRRRRVCMVFQKAHYWLRQPAHLGRATK